ncbi:unnamed protein product [Malus baccata var. baccata]
MRNIERFGFIFYSLSITIKPHYLSGSSSTLSPLLLDGSRGGCQGCLRCASSSRRLPFQPKGSSDLGGEEIALQIALKSISATNLVVYGSESRGEGACGEV